METAVQDADVAARRRTAWFMLVVTVAIYVSTGPAFLNGDAVPARYLPFSVLLERDYDLDEFTFLYDAQAVRAYPSPEGHPYFMMRRNGHYVSRYSAVSPTLAVPFYALPVLAGVSPTSPYVWLLERAASAGLIGLSAVCLFLALCERTERRFAVVLAGLYAFGTGSFSVTSQILWEQTSTQFFLAGALLGVLRAERDRRYLWWAGLMLGGVTVTRPPDLLLAAPLGVYLLVRHRAAALRAATALVPLAAHFAYNAWVLGSAGGSDRAAAHFAWYVWAVPLLDGLYGLLLSPSRGLFIFSPFLLFAVPGIVLAWLRGPQVLRYASVGLVAFVCLYGKYIYWDGGWAYGPRFLLDVTALLCLYLVGPLEWMWGRLHWRRAFVGAGLLSIGIHALGAYTYDSAWEGGGVAPFGPTYARIGRWRESQILWHLGRLVKMPPKPTSANSPHLLGARYEVDARPRTVHAGGVLEVPVTATNTGRALWLAKSDQTDSYFGVVRLAWLWYRDGKPIESTKGREDFPRTIEEGDSVRFAGRIVAPQEPGDYVLKIGLVSELYEWFHDQEVPQIEIAVRVTAPES